MDEEVDLARIFLFGLTKYLDLVYTSLHLFCKTQIL